MFRVRFNFAAQSIDMGIDRMLIARIVVAPDFVEQQIPGENPARLSCQKDQEIELLGCQGDLDTVAQYKAFFTVDGKRPDPDNRRRRYSRRML